MKGVQPLVSQRPQEKSEQVSVFLMWVTVPRETNQPHENNNRMYQTNDGEARGFEMKAATYIWHAFSTSFCLVCVLSRGKWKHPKLMVKSSRPAEDEQKAEPWAREAKSLLETWHEFLILSDIHKGSSPQKKTTKKQNIQPPPFLWNHSVVLCFTAPAR